MLTWNWNKRIGVIAIKDPLDNKRRSINIYKTNCLGALINEWYDKQEKKRMYQVVGFWNDEKHLKNQLGLTKEFKDDNYFKDTLNTIEIRLNTYYSDTMKVAKWFAKAKIKVVLFYQEPKDKGVK